VSFMRAYGWPCFAAAVAALLIQGAVAVFLEPRLAKEAEALAYMKGEAATAARGIEDLLDLRKTITSAQTCHTVFSAFQERRNLPTLILGELARVRPDGLRFTFVDQRDATLDLKGEASSELAIAELLKRVDGSAVLERPSPLPLAAPQAGSSPGYPLAFEVGLRIGSRPQ